MHHTPLISTIVAGLVLAFVLGAAANLLMFGIGLHFTLQDLLSVRTIAVPGAIAQIVSATALGMGLAYLLGWSVAVFGLALSVARTVVTCTQRGVSRTDGSSHGNGRGMNGRDVQHRRL